MRSSIIAVLILGQGCAPTWKPNLKAIEGAPPFVQQGILIGRDEHGELTQSLRISLRKNPDPWMRVPAQMDGDKWVTTGLLDPGDDLPPVIETFIIDTGSFGFLTIPRRRHFVDRLWLSDTGLGNTATAVEQAVVYYGGADTFVLPGVLMAPVPLKVVNDDAVPILRNRSILGLEVLALARAVLIDPAGSQMLLSFDSEQSETVRLHAPDVWITAEWPRSPIGLRTLSVSIDGQVFKAIIDTGADNWIVLRSGQTPRFVTGPITKGTIRAFRGRASLYAARSAYPMLIGEFAFALPEVAWYRDPNQARQSFQPAILGLPFFQSYPTILDFENDRVLFFVGTRDQLDQILSAVMMQVESVHDH